MSNKRGIVHVWDDRGDQRLVKAIAYRLPALCGAQSHLGGMPRDTYSVNVLKRHPLNLDLNVLCKECENHPDYPYLLLGALA